MVAAQFLDAWPSAASTALLFIPIKKIQNNYFIILVPLAFILLAHAEEIKQPNDSIVHTRFVDHTTDKLMSRALKQWVTQPTLDHTTAAKGETSRISTIPGQLRRSCEIKPRKIPMQLHRRVDIVKLFQSWGKGNFHDRFVMEGVVGNGYFGTVYKARHNLKGIVRAVKKVDKRKYREVEAMRDEMDALLDMDHPHVIKFIRYFEDAQYFYLVLELCTGPTLLDAIIEASNSPEGCMSEFDAAVALRDMLKALKSCHAKFIGHYDAKPDNFMYRTPERLRLMMIDFGLSSAFARKSSGDPNAFKGNRAYLAPETYHGIYGPGTDVWSCGVVLFEMLTGSSLFPVDEDEIQEAVEDLEHYVSDNVKWASEQGISPEAHSLLKEMLHPDRHMRITVNEALQHPFVVRSYSRAQGKNFDSKELSEAFEVLESFPNKIREFAAKPMLTRFTLQLVAHLVAHTPGHMRPQQLAFTMLDNLRQGKWLKFGISSDTAPDMDRRDSSGEISYDALIKALRVYKIGIPDDLGSLFKFIDSSTTRIGYGSISFTDFLSITLPPTEFSDKAIFQDVFKFFDADGNGLITAQDLIKVLGCETEEDQAVCRNDMRAICPAPHQLSFEEFVQVIRRGT